MACQSVRFMGMSRPAAASTSSISNDLVCSRAPSSALVLIKRDLTNSPDPAQAVQGRPKPSASKNYFSQPNSWEWFFFYQTGFSCLWDFGNSFGIKHCDVTEKSLQILLDQLQACASLSKENYLMQKCNAGVARMYGTQLLQGRSRVQAP
jgi:hypothetical protein